MASDEDRARIAMEEWKVLHAEILQRNNILMQAIGASVAALITLFGFMSVTVNPLPPQFGFPLACLVLAFVGITWKIVDSDTKNAVKRICEIEEYVNRAFGGDDKMPLSWERRFGPFARTYIDRFKDFDFNAR